MKWLIAAAALVGFSACSSGRYSRNDLQLVTSYTAKEMCACMFVMEQDEAFCRAWTKANPQVAKVSIDTSKKTTHAWALSMWSASAHWVDEKSGCVLDE